MAGFTPPLVDPGGETDNLAVRLGTRKTSHIRNEMRPEWNPDELKKALEICSERFPNMVIRSVTAIYNCVGMVFATRRTWIEPEYVPIFLGDDEYHMLPSIEDAEIGDVAIYKEESDEIKHVGVIIEKTENLIEGSMDFRILSKWGPWAEFIHQPNEIFDSWGQLTEIWTDRKSI